MARWRSAAAPRRGIAVARCAARRRRTPVQHGEACRRLRALVRVDSDVLVERFVDAAAAPSRQRAHPASSRERASPAACLRRRVRGSRRAVRPRRRRGLSAGARTTATNARNALRRRRRRGDDAAFVNAFEARPRGRVGPRAATSLARARLTPVSSVPDCRRLRRRPPRGGAESRARRRRYHRDADDAIAPPPRSRRAASSARSARPSRGRERAASRAFVHAAPTARPPSPRDADLAGASDAATQLAAAWRCLARASAACFLVRGEGGRSPARERSADRRRSDDPRVLTRAPRAERERDGNSRPRRRRARRIASKTRAKRAAQVAAIPRATSAPSASRANASALARHRSTARAISSRARRGRRRRREEAWRRPCGYHGTPATATRAHAARAKRGPRRDRGWARPAEAAAGTRRMTSRGFTPGHARHAHRRRSTKMRMTRSSPCQRPGRRASPGERGLVHG